MTLQDAGGKTPEDHPLILVVDDDVGIRELVSDVLVGAGHRVVVAENGARALALVDAEAPALVLLDLRMPVMDGWTFSRELHARGHAIPIVVMTAARDATRWAVEIGADGWLEKPFDLDRLLDVVRLHTPRGPAPSRE